MVRLHVMRSRYSRNRQHAVFATVLGALALALAACSNPITGGMGQTGLGQAGGGLAERLSLAPRSDLKIEKRKRPEDDKPCPHAVIRDGTQTLRIYRKGGEGDPDFIRYQGSIMKVARECIYSGDEIVTVKFGISGRVVIGPQGETGTFNLPVRAAFLPRGGAPVWGELYQVPVTVNPGESSSDFVMVQQTAAYTIPPGENILNYTLFVGFDESGLGN